MNASRIATTLLISLLSASAWAHENGPPAYRPPMLMTVHDAQLPGLQCMETAINVGDKSKGPMTLLASGCASWTAETCEIWIPRTGVAVAISVVNTLLSPETILGHEASHCWLHNFHA